MESAIVALAERLDRCASVPRGDTAWLAEVRSQLQAFRASLRRHVLSAEDDEGLYADLARDEPRVAPLVGRLRAESHRLEELAGLAVAATARPSPNVGEIRHAVRQLVDLTRRHRSRCTTTVHEAVGVDLGTAVG